jgi:RimK family alpha-L-glutamate ligase
VSRRIAVVTDDPGWHGARLREAFAARGCDPAFVPLQACTLDLAGEPRVVLPGCDGLPEGVFVRGVPGGTLEQVVFYLDVLHALKALGAVVYNEARAIERSVDKGMTSFLLRAAGVATPPTWVESDPAVARRLVERETRAGHELVLKPLFGAQGEGLVRLGAAADLPPPAAVQGVYYLQRLVRSGGDEPHDWRVFVIGGQAVAAMRRSAPGWITNVARGGRCQPAVLDAELRELAEGAVAALDMHYAGVDILRDGAGRPWVLEVNSVPAWRGLQEVCPIDLADALVADFLARCCPSPVMEAVG